MPITTPLITERLCIDELTNEDSEFTLTLLNDADFIRYIGDRQVRTVRQASHYLEAGPLASYSEHGFGMYAMRLRDCGTTIGMCGLVKRESLPDIDIGYALLPAYRGRGYTLEAARSVMQAALDELQLERLVAIVDPDNADSIKLLQRLGLAPECQVRLTPEAPPLALYCWQARN